MHNSQTPFFHLVAYDCTDFLDLNYKTEQGHQCHNTDIPVVKFMTELRKRQLNA